MITFNYWRPVQCFWDFLCRNIREREEERKEQEGEGEGRRRIFQCSFLMAQQNGIYNGVRGRSRWRTGEGGWTLAELSDLLAPWWLTGFFSGVCSALPWVWGLLFTLLTFTSDMTGWSLQRSGDSAGRPSVISKILLGFDGIPSYCRCVALLLCVRIWASLGTWCICRSSVRGGRFLQSCSRLLRQAVGSYGQSSGQWSGC